MSESQKGLICWWRLSWQLCDRAIYNNDRFDRTNEIRTLKKKGCCITTLTYKHEYQSE